MSYKYVWVCYNWKQYGKISIALFVQVAFCLRKRFLPYCFQFREGYKETNFWRPKGYVSYLLTLPFLLWLKDEGHSLGTGTYTSADKHSSSLFIWRFSICIKKKKYHPKCFEWMWPGHTWEVGSLMWWVATNSWQGLGLGGLWGPFQSNHSMITALLSAAAF